MKIRSTPVTTSPLGAKGKVLPHPSAPSQIPQDTFQRSADLPAAPTSTWRQMASKGLGALLGQQRSEPASPKVAKEPAAAALARMHKQHAELYNKMMGEPQPRPSGVETWA